MRQPCGPLLVAVALGSLMIPAQGSAGDENAGPDIEASTAHPARLFAAGRQQIGISAGYAIHLPFRGRPQDIEDTEYVFLAPRWGIGLTDPMGADTWYRGNLELLGEGQFLFQAEPTSGFGGGFAVLIRYNFLPDGRFIPFVEAGAGVLGLDFDVEGQRDGFNFSLQAGLGFHYFVSERTALTGEWRWHHISNAFTREPNSGIDSSLFMIGASFFLK